MAAELGWDEDRTRREIETFTGDLADYHGVSREMLERRDTGEGMTMRISTKARMNRLFTNGGCLDVALDHGVCNEPSFLVGLEDMAGVVDTLVAAKPDAIQMAYGQADLLQSRPEKDKPALVMRIDMGNPYNAQRHRVMWSMLQNHDEPMIGALEMDAACVVVNLFMLPDEPELFRQCVENISRVRADCHRYGMPLMIEPLVMLPNEVRGGYQVDGDADKIVTLVRLASEMGADIIKADPTDDPEDFHRVVEAARVPVLVRGGGKEDLKVVLRKSAALMRQGAKGMVYGRNIYQHASPKAVVNALMAIIHRRRRRRRGLGRLLPWLSAAQPAARPRRREHGHQGRAVRPSTAGSWPLTASTAQPTSPRPGMVERSVAELWDNARVAIAGCLAKAAERSPLDIAAIGMRRPRQRALSARPRRRVR